MSYERIAASDIMMPTKQGTLYRWTTGMLSKWTQGYFVLKDDLLICYKREQDSAPQEVLSLRGAVVMELPVGSEDSFELAAALEMDTEILREAPKEVASCFIIQIAGEKSRIDHWFADPDEESGHEWVTLIKRSLRAPGQVSAASAGVGGGIGGDGLGRDFAGAGFGGGGDLGGGAGFGGPGEAAGESGVLRVFVPGGFCCERCEAKIKQCIGSVSSKGLDYEFDREHSCILIRKCIDDTPDRIVEELINNGIFANVVSTYTTD